MSLRSMTLILIALTCLPKVSCASEDMDQRIREFVIARYHDGRRLIQGPIPLNVPAIAEGLSCRQLYERRRELMISRVDYQPPYWNDPRNQAAVFLGTIWVPAFYFLGYSAITSHLDDLRAVDPRLELDQLRYASAEQRCFEK